MTLFWAILCLVVSLPVLTYLIVKGTAWAFWKHYSSKGNKEMAEHAWRLFRQPVVRTVIEAYNYEKSKI